MPQSRLAPDARGMGRCRDLAHLDRSTPVRLGGIRTHRTGSEHATFPSLRARSIPVREPVHPPCSRRVLVHEPSAWRDASQHLAVCQLSSQPTARCGRCAVARWRPPFSPRFRHLRGFPRGKAGIDAAQRAMGVAGRHFELRGAHEKTREDAMAPMLLRVAAAVSAKRQRTGRGAGTEEAREAFPCVASWEHSDGTAGRPRV
jgi:hypothetical protein